MPKYPEEENIPRSCNSNKKKHIDQEKHIERVCVYSYLSDYTKHSELESIMLPVLQNI